MTYAWQSAGRLRNPRMVWLDNNYNEPRYEIKKWHKPRLRKTPRMCWQPWLRVEEDRVNRQQFPGTVGLWPRGRKARRSARAS